MENPELYSTANGMQKRDAKEILLEFRDRINWKKGGRILDVGCGSGEVTTEIILPQLPRDFKELVGLDISPDMIRHARNTKSHVKVTFVQFDIAQKFDNILHEVNKMVKTCKIPCMNLNGRKSPNENSVQVKIVKSCTILNYSRLTLEKKKIPGFDTILSFYCLHWIPDQRLAFRNIYNLLKPGGDALVVFLVQSPIFILYRELSKTVKWKGYMQDVENFIPFYQDADSPDECFNEIARKEGFQVLTSDCRHRNYVFDSYSSLRKAIAAVNPFLPRIPMSLQEEFIDDCLCKTKMLELAEFRNDHYVVNYKLMVAHFRKPEPVAKTNNTN